VTLVSESIVWILSLVAMRETFQALGPCVFHWVTIGGIELEGFEA